MINELKTSNDKQKKQLAVNLVSSSTQTDTNFIDSATQTENQFGKNQSTQTNVEFIDCFSQTENETAEKCTQIGYSTNSETTQTDEVQEVQNVSIIHDHDYAAYAPDPPNRLVSLDPMKKKYSCTECNDFSTNKKSSFDDHRAEFCKTKAVKNMRCPICDQHHTYRSLRVHLNYYTSSNCQPKGAHAGYTQDYHKKLLTEHKLKKP